MNIKTKGKQRTTTTTKNSCVNGLRWNNSKEQFVTLQIVSEKFNDIQTRIEAVWLMAKSKTLHDFRWAICIRIWFGRSWSAWVHNSQWTFSASLFVPWLFRTAWHCLEEPFLWSLIIFGSTSKQHNYNGNKHKRLETDNSVYRNDKQTFIELRSSEMATIRQAQLLRKSFGVSQCGFELLTFW